MKIGFTGTQKGMSRHQIETLEWILRHIIDNKEVEEIHHGGCIGADQEFNYMCRALGMVVSTVHPASDVHPSKRALLVANYLPPKPALIRNHDIVDAVDTLIAAPAQNQEILRSGTWATIRYAKKINRDYRILSRVDI